MSTTVDADDALATKGIDLSGREDDGLVCAGAVSDARLPVGIEAPGPHIAGLVDRKGVVTTGTEIDDLVLWETELPGDQPVHASALNHLAAELVLLPPSPSENIARFVKGKAVVITADQFGNFFEAGDDCKVVLDSYGARKPEDAFI